MRERRRDMLNLLERVRVEAQVLFKDSQYRDYMLLLVISLCHYTAVMVFFAFPLQVVKWGYDTMDVAILAFSMDGVLLAIRPWVKKLIDKYKAKKALFISSVFLLLVPVILTLAGRSFPLLAVAKAVHGVSLSIFIVANLVYVHALFPPGMIRKALLWLGTTAILPQLFFISLAEKAIMSGRLWLFYGGVAALAVSALMLSLRLGDRGGELESPANISSLLRRKEFFYIAFLVFSQAMVISVSSNFIALLLEKRGISLWRFFTPYAAGTLLVRGPLASWVSKISPRAVLVLGFSTLSLSVALLAVSYNPTWVLVSSFLIGMAFAPLQPTLISVAVERIKYERNALLTAVITSDDMAWTFGPLIGGFLGRSSVVVAYYALVMVAAFAALLSFKGFGGPAEDGPPRKDVS